MDQAAGPDMYYAVMQQCITVDRSGIWPRYGLRNSALDGSGIWPDMDYATVHSLYRSIFKKSRYLGLESFSYLVHGAGGGYFENFSMCREIELANSIVTHEWITTKFKL
jgi:hypothetical protein